MNSNTTPEQQSEPRATVGETLRARRESLGLTLRDVAAVTRIPVAQLQYLEEDRFDEFPAEVFARGFLCNYARELRLDAGTIVERYGAQCGRAPVVTSHAEPSDTRVAMSTSARALLEHPRTLGRVLYGAALAVFVIGLAVAVLVFGGNGDDPSAAYEPADFGDAWQQLPAGEHGWNSSREN
jgi:cytoskeletal protein RodZ